MPLSIKWNAHRIENAGSTENSAPIPEVPTTDESPNSQSDKKAIAFSPRKPVYRLEDVILNDEVKQQIRILKSRIDNHKLLFHGWNLKRINPQGSHISVSFYGPPGTGKTMCAEALASALGKELIEVSYAEIESKYVGETGKNIHAAFESAAKTGALLFFDEADAILGSRMKDVSQAADHAVDVSRAVMLKELDNFDGIAVFATNLFGKYDGAFLRRILQHIEVPLPDDKTREALWEDFIIKKTTIPGRENLNLSELATKSAGLSGGDIKNALMIACSEAVLLPEQRITQECLLSAINQVRTSKLKHDNGDLDITERTVPSEELEQVNQN